MNRDGGMGNVWKVGEVQFYTTSPTQAADPSRLRALRAQRRDKRLAPKALLSKAAATRSAVNLGAQA
jgi:hypothetical protein